jgi:hypothetical protein
LYFEQYSSDVVNTAADRAKATGISRKLLEHKLVHYVHLPRDIFSEVSKLSLIREDITVPSAMAKLQTTMLMLTSMEDQDGFHTQELAT